MPMELIHAAIVRLDTAQGEATLGGVLGVEVQSDDFVMLCVALKEAISVHAGEGDALIDAMAHALLDSMLVIALQTGILTEDDLSQVTPQ